MESDTTMATSTDADTLIQRRSLGVDQIKETISLMREMDKSREDWVVPTSKIQAAIVSGRPSLALDLNDPTAKSIFSGPVAYELGEIAHDQLGVHCGIPGKYYDRCRAQAPDLWAANVNEWIDKGDDGMKMVRIMQNRVRAFLSNSYLALDNVDVFFSAFQAMEEARAQITAITLTPSRFHVEMTKPGFELEIKFDGHFYRADQEHSRCVPYVVLSNSEVGRGGLNLDIGLLMLWCSNGMLQTRPVSRIHRGKTLNAGFISDETRRLDAELIFSTVRDAVRFAFNNDEFEKMVAKLSASTGEYIEDPKEACATIQQHYTLSDEERDRLLNEFAAPTLMKPSPTVFGLSQALTFIAHDVTDLNRRYDLERAGADLFENTPVHRALVPVIRH